LVDDLGSLAPALQPLLTSLAVERPPTPPPQKDVAAEVARLVADQRPCATALQVTTLEAQAGKYRVALAAMAGMPEAEEPLQKLLDDTLAKLAKTSKHAPSAGTEVMGLEKAAATHQLGIRERADRHEAGAAKTKERAAERLSMIGDLRALLLRAEREVSALEVKLATDHEADRKLRTDFDQQVTVAIEEKIKAAKAGAARVTPVPHGPTYVMPPPEGAPAGSNSTASPSLAIVAAPVQNMDMAELTKQKEAVELQLKALKDAFDARAAMDATNAAYEVVIPGVSLDDLPILAAADFSDVQLRACGLTWWVLARWAGAGAACAFTAGEAARELGMSVDEVVAVFSLAVGQQRALLKGGPQDIISRQCCLLVQQSLSRLKDSYEAGPDVEATRQQARAAFDAIETVAKKRRCGQ